MHNIFECIFAPGPECRITSVVGTVRRCADVVVTHHRGLGFTGQVAARGLVERSAASGAVARAVRGRVGPSVAGYGRLPTWERAREKLISVNPASSCVYSQIS